VPLIGIFGWGCFAAATILVLSSLPPGWRPMAAVVAPLVTHGMLLASWWGFFRWVGAPIPESTFAGVTVVVCALLTAGSLRWRRRAAIPLDEMVARMTAAAFFFSLLFLYNRGNTPLVVFSVAFAPPWLALMSFQRPAKNGSSGSPVQIQRL